MIGKIMLNADRKGLAKLLLHFVKLAICNGNCKQVLSLSGCRRFL